MQLFAAFVATLLGVACAYFIHQRVFESSADAAKAKKLDCKPPVVDPYHDPSGFCGMFLCIRAHRQNRLPVFVQERIDNLQALLGRPVKTFGARMLFFKDVVFTLDPLNIQAILGFRFRDFDLGVNRTENFKPILGDGIFAATGKQWEHSRALLRPQLLNNKIDLGREEAHISALISVLELRQGSGGWTDFVNLQDLFLRYTLESTTDFLFGERIYLQPAGTSVYANDAAFAEAVDFVQSKISTGAKLGPQYWLMHTPKFRRAIKTVDDFVGTFLQAAVEQAAKSPDASDQGKHSVLQALMKETSDPTELRNQLLSILLAGRDTTASTLGWFFYIMAEPRHKDVFGRLKEAVIESFGHYSDASEVSLEKIKSCQYLQWCISECLRLYPAVPISTRVVLNDTYLPTGGGLDGESPIFMKKGEEVAYSVHLMQRCQELWGPDAEEFRPERWKNRCARWIYLPFNGGPRTCIGQQYALTRIAHLVIRLVQRIEAIDGSRLGPVQQELTLVNCPAKGVNVRLRLAK
ncbi:hypothetical protein HIM_02396 [Hirsutella minnesotensis 3608]|nr:hypothetical protein HIM_02396 [Hirsutella minnesotensis 3608]